MFTSRCACRSGWRRHARPRLQRVAVAELQNITGRDRLLAALRAGGAVILVTTTSAAAIDTTVSEAYSSCRRFFARPFDEKALHGAGAGVGQLHGYMSYLDDDEVSECFEAKLNHDPRFIWPETPAVLQRAVVALQQLLLRHALAVLAALVTSLGLDVEVVAGMLDHGLRRTFRRAHDEQAAAGEGSSGEPSATRGAAVAAGGSDGLVDASHSSLRVWSYSGGRPAGWHCDNTLLTIAPAGSEPGLVVRTLAGDTFCAEEEMRPGELLLFVGDALSYLTSGALLPLMHRVVPPPPAAVGRDRPPRLSAPFFLRGRQGAMLRAAPAAGLPSLRVADLEHNAGNLRSRWPWKRARREYFDGVSWHPSEERSLAPEGGAP